MRLSPFNHTDHYSVSGRKWMIVFCILYVRPVAFNPTVVLRNPLKAGEARKRNAAFPELPIHF